LHLLVATAATQGSRSSDFDLVFGPEPVQLAPVCGRDGDDPDGACGCARAFIGIRSGRPVTTAAVIERDITPDQFRSMLRHGYRFSGMWRGLSEDEIHARAEHTATVLEQLVADLIPGIVVERRGDVVTARAWSATAGQPRPEPDRGEPDHDNGFVSICAYGDDRDELFPAWISPHRWNGFAVPIFSRSTAARVVDWTNRLHAETPDAAARAIWDGSDILLYEPGWEEFGPSRIRPNDHGRYAIGGGWVWEEEHCWMCWATAHPGEDEGSLVLLHEPGCVPAEQWPLADHSPRPRP